MTDNTLPTAQNLGSLTSLISVTGLVGDTDFRDYYRFDLTSNSNLNIALNGGADIRLIRDFDGDGVVDSNEVIASSITTGIAESINLFNLASGIYFVEVARFSTSDTNYQLSLSRDTTSNLIAQEQSLGNLSATPITRFGFVGSNDTSDIYRLSLASTSDINISLTGLSADADVRLIRDTNNNGVVDSGEVIASSTFGSSVSELIGVNNQAAGNYFVQVYSFSIVNANNTSYTLRLSNADPNNLIAEEANLGNLSATPATYFGSINNTDTSEIVRFSLASISDINISLTGLSADADLQLIRDANNNGVVDSGEVIASSTRGGTTDDSINLNNQAAGNYFVQVYQFSSNATSYTLRLSNDQPSSLLAIQENFGFLTGGTGITRSDFVGNSDTSDIYRFSLNTTRTVTASISGLTADADLRLIRDFNSNGIVDGVDEIVRSAFGGTTTDSINRVLGAGDYFLQAYQFNGETNYNLAVNAL